MGSVLIDPCVGRADAYRLFVQEGPLNAGLVDLNARFIAASRPLLANARLAPEQVIGLTIFELFPSSEAGLEEIAHQLAAGRESHTTVRQAYLPDGRVRWISCSGSYWHDDAGAVGGFLVVNQDVTAEYEADSRRREVEALLEAVVDNIPATLVVQDSETAQYLLVNARASAATGLSPKAMIGRTPEELFTDGRASVVREGIQNVKAAGGFQVVEQTVEGGPVPGLVLRFKRLIFEDVIGRPRMLSIGEDITALRKATRALEVAAAEAEAANATKSSFLANVSHEIRTPLNGVLGMAQAMAHDPLSEQQRERLEIIRRSGQCLLTLLNDLLDLSKIEAGKLEIETIEFDAVDVLRSASSVFGPLAEQKGLQFDLLADDALGVCRGDPTRLRQVISNLMSNALKFTERGGIELSACRLGEEVQISVHDTGLGMTPETIAKLFGKFAQAEASTARQFGGTGLGLSISRNLVELMGGRISVESALERGSRFTISLPLPRVGDIADLSSKAGHPGAAPTEIKVLAAEDNQVNRLVLKTLLEQAGIMATIVDNGAEAVDAWGREAWDVILMDVQMPVLDGPSATAAIRRREAAEGRRRTPIIALTANAMSHHAAEYLGCGMDALVPKPIQVEALFAALETVLSAHADNTPAQVA
jgi:PAS domain S-box-containing protein